ncbi:general secretory pathway protein GspE [Sulfurimicrobium lacus]|uniref:General secretory pathway protein GspE n=1 Tax=Sulfurimicrobium lacus TaxID=2715678 RepID=A0A6F8VD17_9PROT|nr:ATPase, T2SS/T4P/T4SS family [Sulfurimicrobium lacus]BCB26906.1 general secretory pathway protein GspE [Sulfurimicrobium lacus]
MNTQASANTTDLSGQLIFSRKLQAVTNKIHATQNIDEIMLQLSSDISALFEADRLTIYSVSEDKSSIATKIKTGLGAFKDFKLPISPLSVAGYVAFNKMMVNIADVYDDAELKKYNPGITFLKDIDRKTGYRTKQMLVAPIIDANDGELMGVIQLINSLSGSPFPTSAEEGLQELAKTLAIAFKHRSRIRTKFDYLIDQGILSAAEIELAARSAHRKGKDIEEILLDEFQVNLADLGRSLTDFYHVPYEPFKADRIKSDELLKNLKREYVEGSLWLPIDDTPEGLVILTPEPDRIMGSRVVCNIFPKHKLLYKVCTRREFAKTLELFYGAAGSMGSIDDLLSNLQDEDIPEGASSADEMSAAADNELVKLVNKIIVDAYNQGASDIHIEPYPGKNKTIVRFRRDGTLFPYIEIPPSHRAALLARLKIMCDLDISEKRKPQDGKIMFKKYGPLDIELRVATIPTAGGLEDVVMRILAAGKPIPVDNLGLSARNLETLKKVVSKPYGLFLVCGPTGSGKTTTLHSVLGYINTPETKIWTAEDPVEITQKGLRQVQVNPKAGITFAVAMRAFLRADPDVVMVGEMRDKETVATGIEASLTGHLVFSTLHTNSAPESIVRLLDMGMDPFNFADALLGILAQRLGKRLCSKCKKPYVASEQEIESLLSEYAEELKNTPEWLEDASAARDKLRQEWKKSFANDKGEFVLNHAVGCEECNKSGYKGRVGLHELLVGSDEIKKNIQEHARVADMTVTALSQGMRTLRQDGIEKVLQGITDMKQVRSVCIK